MKLKRTKLQIVDTEKRYYNNPDQTESGSNSFWTIFCILLIILILIIVFIICYRYIYGQIIYFCKRCLTRRNKKSNTDDNFSVIKESGSGSCIKRRLLWPNTCNFSKFHIKYDRHRRKERENKCKLRTLLQERKKLLAPSDNKTAASTSNIDLTKQLSLEMTCSSLSSNQAKYKGGIHPVSIRRNTGFPKNHERDELRVQNIENIRQNTHGYGRDICFSDTDLRFLTSLKKYKSIRKDERPLLWKWNSGNIINNSQRGHNASSKLIDLKYNNMDSLKNNTQKDEISTLKSSCSPHSWVPKAIADSKYFSDSAPSRSHISTNKFLKQLKRSTDSCCSSTESKVSNRIKAGGEMLNINSEAQSNKIKIDKLKGIKLQMSNDSAIYTKKMLRKMKSSVDIFKNRMKEVKSSRKTKSNENFVNTISIKHDNVKHLNTQQSFTSENVVHNNENMFCAMDNYSEISETYDELGILFSQYIKIQTHPCYRKYCFLKRHLNHKMQHSTRKCQIRFNYPQIYPYDQRPACNSGNICTDTYDELKLMYTSPADRRGIYQRMFKRRKHFLNQPCILSDRNFVRTKSN